MKTEQILDIWRICSPLILVWTLVMLYLNEKYAGRHMR